jgi:hypothetical protein
MSRYSMFIAGGALSLAVSGAVQAQTATQTVTFAVNSINKIAASGSPSLTITTATAGSQPTQATFTTATYDITTNDSTRKITIEINADMPTGVTLKANLTAPTASGLSAGAVTLSHTTPLDAVTGITQVAQAGIAMAYTLDALVTAGVVASDTRTVTLTVVAGP